MPLALPGQGSLRSIAAAPDGTVVAVGSRGDASGSFVWLSAGGSRWSPVTDLAEDLTAAEVLSVVAGGPGFVAVGRVPLEDPTDLAPGFLAGGLVPVGGSFDSSPRLFRPGVWVSPDGWRWDSVGDDQVETAAGLGAMHRVAEHRGRLVAVGFEGEQAGEYAAATRFLPGTGGGAIWWSDDGIGWQRAALEGPGDQADGILLVDLTSTSEGLVAVGSRDGRPAAWSSPDGKRWSAMPGLGSLPGNVVTSVTGLPAGGALATVAPAGTLDYTLEFPYPPAELWYAAAAGSWTRVPQEGLTNLHPTLLRAVGEQVVALSESPGPVTSLAMAVRGAGGGPEWEPVSWGEASGLGYRARAGAGSVGDVLELEGAVVAVGGDGLQPRVWVHGSNDVSVSIPAPPAGSGRWVEVSRFADLELAEYGFYNFFGGGTGTVAEVGSRLFWSEDGTTWVGLRPGLARGVAPPNLTFVVQTRRGLLAASFAGRRALIWRSRDGITWDEEADFGPGVVLTAAEVGGSQVAWGYLDDGAASFTAVYDGGWAVLDRGGPFPIAVAPWEEGLLSVALVDGGPELLTSRDGTSWQPVAGPPDLTVEAVIPTSLGPLAVGSDPEGYRLLAVDQAWSPLPIGTFRQWPVVSDFAGRVAVLVSGPARDRLFTSPDLVDWIEVPLDLESGMAGANPVVVPAAGQLQVAAFDRGEVVIWAWEPGRPR